VDKEVSREVRRQIRKVLMEEWDPISVNDTPEAADEYDLYIGGVYELRAQEASQSSVEDHVRRIEVERMGMIDVASEPLMSEGKRKAAVSSIIKLRPYFDEPS
jgi:hypothetical protein